MWSTGDIHHNAYSMPSFQACCKCMYKGSAGSCLRNGWYIIGRCLHFDNIAGHKNADSFKAAPGIVRCFGRIRVPASLCLSLRPRVLLFLSLFRSSGVPTTRPASLFRSGANHHHPNCTPDVLLPTTLALSTVSSSQLLPHLGPAALLRVPQTYPASRDSLFFRANGNRTHPSSAFPPSFSPSAPFTLTPLSALPANCFQRFSWPALSLALFLEISPFLQIHWSVDQTIAYNCDSWHNLY